MSSGPGRREVAHRLFAAEFEDADLSYSESDEERAPNYVVTPTGARVNRLFFVGVLTEKERVNEDMLRARVVDPTDAFVTYAGQYQPDELAFLERVDPPAFLAVTGKARTFQPEDSDRVYTSARPESISRVDADTRDRWVVQAAERTVDRVRVMASAIESGLRGDALEGALSGAGVDASLAQGVALALDHYDTTPAYLAEQRRLAVQAAETITGERDEVDRSSLAPDEGDGEAGDLADPELVGAIAAAESEAETEPAEPDSGASGPESVESHRAEAGSESAAPESEPEPPTDPDPEPEEPGTAEAEPEAAEAEPAVAGASAAESTADPEDVGVVEGGENDDLGDFEPGEFDAEEVDDEDLDDALTEKERQEVEENFDTGFSTGNEVERDPLDEDDEEADRPDEAAEDADSTEETEPESPGEPESEVAPGTEEDPEAEYETEPEPSDETDTGVAAEASDTDEVDLESAVMDAMRELDDGDGADHDEVVQAVADEYGVAVGDAEDAVQDALMSGQCYEPADGKLKPI